MFSLGALLVLTLAFVVFIFIIFYRNGKKKLPPGPTGIPFFGNLLQLGDLRHLKLKEWVKVYGPIFQIKMGANRVIVISDSTLIREAFNDPRMLGRYDHKVRQVHSNGPYGLANTEGNEWVELRRFSLKTLRDLGFGKKSMEGLIMDEVNDLMTFLKSTEGQPISPEQRLNISIFNTIWEILSAGNRVKQDDEKFLDLFERQNNTNFHELLLFGGLWDVLENLSKSFLAPVLLKILPVVTKWNALLEVTNDITHVFRQHINEHKKTRQEGSEPRDFIDAHLQEIESTRDPHSCFSKEKGEKNLIGLMADFFQAGPDTTSTTLAWGILYLAKFPNVQHKVQSELDQIVGRERQATLADRNNLPYVCATIEEILRLSSIVPLGLFHRALADITFHGYHIPRGTWICHNQYYHQRSEEIWGDPDEFRPERHLSPDETTLKPRHEANLPFGVGKRACVGESVARDLVYLFFVNIFQKYKIELSAESQNVPFDAKPGFILHPPDYTVVMTERI